MKKKIIGVEFGNCRVILEDTKEVMGHDDSLPYNTKFSVILDGKDPLFSGSAWNDGWGGTSCYSLNIPKGAKADKVRESFEFVDDVLKKTVSFKYRDMTFNLGLIDVIDYIAELAIYNPKCVGSIYTQEAFIKYLER